MIIINIFESLFHITLLHFPMSLKYLGKYYFNFCILCHYMEIAYLNFSIVEHVDKNFGKYMYPYFRTLFYNGFLEVELVYSR